jgi:threonine dehydrogenase-like Zn-dependent dehydrogenase
MPPAEHGERMGHEFLGVVGDLGSDVSGLKRGDLVVAPFVWSDNTCDFCREGLHTSCRHGGLWGRDGIDGGQGEAVRVPQAQGTLVKLPVAEDSALLPSLLTLSDVFCTGHHCAVTAGVDPRTTVTVVGDGAVGLSAVLAAKRLGAERIILMGRHKDRTDLGRDFGATDVVSERGEEGIERVRELTRGDGTHTVLECVGTLPALQMSLGAVRPGGTISRVGAPQYGEVPLRVPEFDEAATWVSSVAFEKDVKRNFALREHTYTQVKERWGLGAQATQHVIKKTCDAYATLKANLKAGNPGKPWQHHSQWRPLCKPGLRSRVR